MKRLKQEQWKTMLNWKKGSDEFFAWSEKPAREVPVWERGISQYKLCELLQHAQNKFGNDVTTRVMMEKYIKPQTEKLQVPYWELIRLKQNKDNAKRRQSTKPDKWTMHKYEKYCGRRPCGKPSVFISHAWDMQVSELIKAIKKATDTW